MFGFLFGVLHRACPTVAIVEVMFGADGAGGSHPEVPPGNAVYERHFSGNPPT